MRCQVSCLKSLKIAYSMTMRWTIFDADQDVIGKIAHFQCRIMDFLHSQGSNMGRKQCCGDDILPKEINLVCQM